MAQSGPSVSSVWAVFFIKIGREDACYAKGLCNVQGRFEIGLDVIQSHMPRRHGNAIGVHRGPIGGRVTIDAAVTFDLRYFHIAKLCKKRDLIFAIAHGVKLECWCHMSAFKVRDAALLPRRINADAPHQNRCSGCRRISGQIVPRCARARIVPQN